MLADPPTKTDCRLNMGLQPPSRPYPLPTPPNNRTADRDPTFHSDIYIFFSFYLRLLLISFLIYFLPYLHNLTSLKR